MYNFEKINEPSQISALQPTGAPYCQKKPDILVYSIFRSRSGEEDEFDTSMLAKEEDLPSDEEELARHLMERYQDDEALKDKHLLKKLKERFVHVSLILGAWVVSFLMSSKPCPVLKYFELFEI